MKLWGGRFTKEENELVNAFNASISFDQRFYRQDIRGSIAHVTMLAKQGILKDEERDQIVKGLEGILSDLETGALSIDPLRRGHSQLCGGGAHKPYRRRGKEAPHGKEPQRPGGPGYEALCAGMRSASWTSW